MGLLTRKPMVRLPGKREPLCTARGLGQRPHSDLAGRGSGAFARGTGTVALIPMATKRAFVYILCCADSTYYIGIARDVARRLEQHNARKGAKYTKSRLPVRVVFQEGPFGLTRALRREYQLKQLTRSQKAALIKGELRVPRLR